MLKIKDNVDLKELEKYGFKEEHKWYEKGIEYTFQLKIYYYVMKNTKQIQVGTYDGYDIDLDNTLYDLIQADLVEKVDEE